MAKPAKYPKKFRQKLEKMAEARAERTTADTEAHENRRVFNTLWHEFLPKASVDTVYARIDHDERRIDTEYFLFPRVDVDTVYATPPWLPSETETPDPE